jgi:hypothetical protein
LDKIIQLLHHVFSWAHHAIYKHVGSASRGKAAASLQ